LTDEKLYKKRDLTFTVAFLPYVDGSVPKENFTVCRPLLYTSFTVWVSRQYLQNLLLGERNM
ncbi:hypothetical protein, partial [Enterococcus faecium]|uniref:hypothetical protein n=1 Tax=Enterococcus faecium TaxID=1352 RepID=UPI003DA0EFB2